MMKHYFLLILCLLIAVAVKAETVHLEGRWRVALNNEEALSDVKFDASMHLPGTTDGAGLGEANALLPSLTGPQIQHLTRRHSYSGAAWYQRSITISAAQAHKPLTFLFERVMWQSQLWIDRKTVGRPQESLSAPHEYTLPQGLPAGRHTLTLRIDNRKQYDVSWSDLAHAFTNDTQVKWNGVLGRMEMQFHDGVIIRSVEVYPDIDKREITVLTTLDLYGRAGEYPMDYRLTDHSPVHRRVKLTRGHQQVRTVLPMPQQPRLWNEFSQPLYRLQVSCGNEEAEVTFGLRSITAHGRRLMVNGRRIFLRGTLECCVFPLTGTPPMTEEGWLKTFMTAKQWGLNHLRFHSWCPPEAAFRVADRLGFYLQVELPQWSLTVNRDTSASRFIREEFERIVSHYGNHPSLCLISCGNELQPDFRFLNSLVTDMRRRDPRHLYTTTTFTFEKGHGRHPEPQDQFFVTQYTDSGWVRGQGVFEAEAPCFDKDYMAATRFIGCPILSHEVGQYAVYPAISEIEKYRGTLLPLNLMAVRENLKAKGLLGKAAPYTHASGALAAILYKEEMERVLKTDNMSGFQLLGLNDFPGQGTALVGLLDAFWDSKGVTDYTRFTQACAQVVPLARFPKAVYTSDDSFAADIEIANHGADTLHHAVVSWQLMDDERHIVAQGEKATETIPTGSVTPIGGMETALHTIGEAKKLTLEVAIDDTPWRNRWSIWVYPAQMDLAVKDVLVTRHFDEAARALKKGRKVLLIPDTAMIRGIEGKFLPVFWSPVHFPRQAGTMGLLCHNEHPALRSFPTDNHTDWQWWNLTRQSKTMIVDSIKGITPIVENIDNFVNNRRLTSLFETRVGQGRLIVCSFDLLTHQATQPEVRQLYHSLLRYMQSADFKPVDTIDPISFRHLSEMFIRP